MKTKESVMVLIDEVKRELSMIDDLISNTTERLSTYEDLPHRTLVLRVRGTGHPFYYEQEWIDGKKVVYYLGSIDCKKAARYKQQHYLNEKLKILVCDKKAAEQFLKHFTDYSYEEIVKRLPPSYREISIDDGSGDSLRRRKYKRLPDSIVKDERFQKLVKWANEPYTRNPYPLPDDPNIARDGTPMRSKGECIWYDDILFEELPARIEPELEIQGKSGQWHKLHPDFMFLCFDGTIILVEHFGRWDDEKYAERNKRKIQEYLDCGFVLGDNLIVTSDNADHCTNEKMIVMAIDMIKARMFA